MNNKLILHMKKKKTAHEYKIEDPMYINKITKYNYKYK